MHFDDRFFLGSCYRRLQLKFEEDSGELKLIVAVVVLMSFVSGQIHIEAVSRRASGLYRWSTTIRNAFIDPVWST
jgi:hypothetical protein